MTFVLLLFLLATVGRSPLWSALYWLNPLIVKELMNSAHMEAILLPFLLATVLLLALRRPLAASMALGLAIGTKIWPVVLLPLVLRPLLSQPLRLAAALAILMIMTIAWVAPIYWGGLGPQSGFLAYAVRWQTNSALFQLLQTGMSRLLDGMPDGTLGDFHLSRAAPGVIVRALLGAIVMCWALWIARRDTADPADIVRKCTLVVLAMFLLSPAQFPWYAGWVLIFAAILPLAGILSLTVLMPLYYVSFHLFAVGSHDRWNYPVIAVEWLLIALCFAWDARQAWRRPLVAKLDSAADPIATRWMRH